ncbi:MAG TPA: sigma-70 family RNA polymerase sigma factor [Longimicrobiales bacterium]
MGVERGPGVLEGAPALSPEYDEWLRELRRYVHRLTGDPDMSEDVAQEAVLRYIRATPATPVRSPRAWLYRTATNLVRDQARHEAMLRRREVPVDADTSSTPEQDLERNEAIREVRDALERIPARDRELLILRESGFRYREIAEVIGVKTESVPVLAARALERFRVAYSGGAG